MRFFLLGSLVFVLSSFSERDTAAPVEVTSADQHATAAPLKLSPEEQRVVDVAQDFLNKTKRGWENPVEVKGPPNRVNVPDWKKYVEDEKHVWKVVYETPAKEMKAVGARTLFVNMRTKDVIPSARK